MTDKRRKCNQICQWNDSADGCVKPHGRLCPMVSADPADGKDLQNVTPIWKGQAAEQREVHKQAVEGFVNIYEDMLTTGENLVDLIRQSIVEAFRHGIKADSIVINKHMVFVPGLIGERPPMICGLNAYVTDELPQGYTFGVLESQRPKTNADRIRAMSDDELVSIVRTIAGADVCHMSCSCSECVFRTICSEDEYGKVLEWCKQPAEEQHERR